MTKAQDKNIINNNSYENLRIKEVSAEKLGLEQCEICGAVFRKLKPNHLKIHNISSTEYRKKYPDNAIKGAHKVSQDRFSQNKIEKRKKINFNWKELKEEEQQILLGNMLGDGYINNYNNRASYFEVYHSNTKEFYLDWLIKKLKRLNSKKHKWTRYWNEYGRIYTRLWMTTSSCEAIEYLNKLFYNKKNNKKIKIIKREALDLLKPLGIAVWFMDDGFKNGKQLYISTQSFTFKENEIIKKWFKDKYKIETDILITNKQFYIVIRDSEKLIDLIKPFILPQFLYKINLEKTLVKEEYVEVVKKVHFNSAHFLEDYYSKCFNMHGERYELEITLNLPIDPLTGFAIDFGDINNVFKETIEKRFDHRVVNLVCEELKFTATAELMIVILWKILKDRLPNLTQLKLYENPEAWVIYKG